MWRYGFKSKCWYFYNIVFLWIGTKFGFIEYADRKGAEAAIGLDGVLLGGRPVRVGLSNGPIIQPTAYGPGAETMRNKPPLFRVSEVIVIVVCIV